MDPTDQFPRYVIDRVMAKRGRLHVFDSLEPTRTAFLVIDMQEFYVKDVESARDIVANINRIARHMRECGGLVVWVCMTAGQSGTSLWPVYHRYFFTAEKGAAHRDQLSADSPGHRLWPELDVDAEQDLIASKNRFSPFVEGASTLHHDLGDRRIENVIIGGTATNFCCETTARDAMMLGYRVVMAADANAARYPEDHLAGLTSVFQSFGDVMSTDQIVSGLLTPEG